MFLMQIVILYFPSLSLSVIFLWYLFICTPILYSEWKHGRWWGGCLSHDEALHFYFYIYIYIYLKNFIPLLYFVLTHALCMLQVPNRSDLFSRFIHFGCWTVHQLLECFSVIMDYVMEVALLIFAFNTSAVVGAFLHNKLVSIWNYCPFFSCSSS
jgi:hypothetical protein